MFLFSCSSDLMQSPDKSVSVSLFVDEGHLCYKVYFHGKQVLDSSRLGLIVDGDTLGTNVLVRQVNKS